jgi:nucleoside-diphosphate-sugar epimerase
MVRNVLLAGASGKQGWALIDALRPNPAQGDSSDTLHVLALTRNAASPNAKHLLSESHVTLVEGDLDSPASIRKIFEDAKATGGVWGVFCVLAFPGLGANSDGEEKQGKVGAKLADDLVH